MKRKEALPLILLIFAAVAFFLVVKGYRVRIDTPDAIAKVSLEPQLIQVSEQDLAAAKAVAESHLLHLQQGEYEKALQDLRPDVRRRHTVAELKKNTESYVPLFGKLTGFQFLNYQAYSNVTPQRITLNYMLKRSKFGESRSLPVDKLNGRWHVAIWYSAVTTRTPSGSRKPASP